jgi:hypothetical protein
VIAQIIAYAVVGGIVATILGVALVSTFKNPKAWVEAPRDNSMLDEHRRGPRA